MKKEYSIVLIALLKGVVYRHQDKIWEILFQYETDVRKYFKDIHLNVNLDKSEGYAFLEQEKEFFEEDEVNTIPRLIENRQLNFNISLMCLLLRKHLIENDSQGNSSRAILSLEDIVNMMKPFMKETSDEVKQHEQIKQVIKKVIDEGFLRKLSNQENFYEIDRIIKAFIKAEIVQEYLDKYKKHKEEKDA